MQPTLAITAPRSGIVYLNGRFLGETDPHAPLLTPVRPFGAIHIEYRPLTAGIRSLNGKLVLSGGKPLPESPSASGDMFCVHWPGNIIEIELVPRADPEVSCETFRLEGRPCRIHRGDACRIEIDGRSFRFPTGGDIPTIVRTEGRVLLTGSCTEGDYLLLFSADLTAQTGYLIANRIDRESADAFRALIFRRDIAGHAVLERWQMSPDGLCLLSREPAWEHDAPRQPDSPEETALAAVQAAMLGMNCEAETYLSAGLRQHHPLDTIAREYSDCLPMKYTFPDGRMCIGLFKPEGSHCASVHPLFYTAEPAGDRWQLTALSL